MTSLPVEEPPSKKVLRLRIKYNRTTIVLNILLISDISVLLKKVMHCLEAVAFFLGVFFLDTLHVYFLFLFKT